VAEIPFVEPLDDVRYGRVEQVSPSIRRVIANNPGKFSYRGTGTYIVGHGDVAVIDPGPDLPEHRDALAAALRGERVRAILVTHCHADHSPLSAWMRAETGAPTIAFGPHGAVDPEPDEDDDGDPAADSAGGDGSPSTEPKETIDLSFVPDVRVGDGDIAAVLDGITLRAVHTPGHTSNHLCFSMDAERVLFSGDHVMGWSTTVVSPPDGDMRAYIESLRKVAGRGDAVLWPTHGNPVTDVGPFLDAYLAHRLEREAQVLDLVRAGVGRIPDMVEVLYADVRKELHRAAARSVLAHLVKLVDDGSVSCSDPLPRRGSIFASP
jgi:glyoxylase-like metal-dependent hydrolase (beta-lactamase superfamily II)